MAIETLASSETSLQVQVRKSGPSAYISIFWFLANSLNRGSLTLVDKWVEGSENSQANQHRVQVRTVTPNRCSQTENSCPRCTGAAACTWVPLQPGKNLSTSIGHKLLFHAPRMACSASTMRLVIHNVRAPRLPQITTKALDQDSETKLLQFRAVAQLLIRVSNDLYRQTVVSATQRKYSNDYIRNLQIESLIVRGCRTAPLQLQAPQLRAGYHKPYHTASIWTQKKLSELIKSDLPRSMTSYQLCVFRRPHTHICHPLNHSSTQMTCALHCCNLVLEERMSTTTLGTGEPL